MWYHSAPPSIRNRKCTASSARIVSTPATTIVAVPTLKGPYRAPYTSRSPTGNGTAVGAGAGAVALAVTDPEAGGAARVESVRLVSDCARSEVAITRRAAAVRAARMMARAWHASNSWRHGLTLERPCTRS